MKRERVIELWLAGFVLVAGLIVVVVLLGTAAADGPPMSERVPLSFSPIHNLLPTNNVYAFGHLGVDGNIIKRNNFEVDPLCTEQDGCYPYGDGCEERDYYCKGNETGCNYTSSNRHTDGWVDTGNTRWVDMNKCKEKEQKEQEYRDYKCSAGSCHYSINDTKWIDTGICSSTCNDVSLAPPEITSFAPLSYVDDTVCNWRTFDVTVNQAANVSWYLNNTLVLTNEGVLEAKCTLHADVVGEHNVTAIASNANGSDMQMWIWEVTELPKECEGTDTSCGIYPNCGNCNEKDGCYPHGDGCEEGDYYCMGKEAGCNYTSSNRHTDGWADTGNTRWVDVDKCKEKEQKEQEYRDYKCSAGCCHYSINDTKWIDTGNTSIKANGTICDCTADNTVKRCYDGNCTDTGIGNSSNCSADVACDGKKPGESCGAGRICNSTCNCVSLAPPEITSFAPLSYVDDTVCNWRTFNVTVNQAANVSWYLNDTLVLTTESVLEAKCMLHAEVVGEHNVTAIASNANGSDMQMWIWAVIEESSYTFELSTGWNMISFPVELQDKDADTIFGPEYYYLVTWDPDTGGYVPVDAVETEIGYWLLVLEDRNVTVLGTPLSGYNTNLTQGWNMIGSIWADTNVLYGTETVPADQLYPYLYAWSVDHYVLAQDIDPELGYWALAYIDCELHVFPAPPAAPLPLQQITWGDNDWRVRLAITSGAGTDVAEFGLHDSATDDFTAKLDVPEPPSPPPSSTLPYQQAYFYYLENPLVKKLSTSYIPSHSQECNIWHFQVDYNGDASDVTITWNAADIAAVPVDCLLLFVDDIEIDMRTTPSYTFIATTGTYEFEIRAITGGEKPDLNVPDLNVTAIELNCGYLFGNETNEICATVMNNGTADAGAFNVSFEIDGYSTRRKVNGLAAGENITVCIHDWTPRNAGDSVLITVTADSDAEIDESNETNNAATLVTTVVNNGYKGKAYTGGSDITTWNTFDLKGDLLYSVGDSYYLSLYSNPVWTTYTANWTTSNLPVPGTATIEEVRLYVIYTWDKAGVMPDEVGMTFNGIAQALAAHYSDEKGWATSYPYGMLAYDVTDAFDTSGNTAVFTNSHPGGGNVSMRGMLLVVVYADDGEPQRKIFVNEEFDILYGGVGECTTPAEATAWAPFGAIDLSQWDDARLITVAPGADANEGDLIFNWNKWTAVWNDAGSTQIGIDDRKVSLYLQSANNIAGFQSDGDYMEASNAFLILEKKVEPKPDIWVDPTSFDVTLSTNTIQDYTMRIGNDGEATLMYDISDDETTPKAVVHSEVSEEAVVEALVESHEHTIELFPSRSISYPILWIPHEISYDDGTAEGAIAWVHAGGRWAVRFTPPSYPVDLDTARICLWSQDEDYEPFYIEVYDDDGAEGSPGTLLGTVMTIATADGWHDVDISGLGITITSGDFYITYMPLTDLPKCEMLSYDKTDPQGRSWGGHSGSWGTWPEYNWMIRCVVDLLGYCPWLDENPKSGSVLPGKYTEITVTIDTTGLAKGDYSANIIIANNDPYEDPTIVPVDLTVTEEKPDLVITEKWLCWPDNCTICYNVTNTGDGTAPACHNTTLYADGVAVAHDPVPVDLAPGESYTGCFGGYDWTYTPPSDNITVCADNNESIVELNENNNCLSDIWMCGDVTGDGRVRTSDGRRIFRHLTFGDPIDNMWAADVTGDGRVRTSDGRRIFRHLTFGDPLNCNCSG